jgi:hypothetical protein
VSATIEVAVEGIGTCAPGIADWPAMRTMFDGAQPTSTAFARPTSALLAPNERRRAPDSVLLAVNVAEQACTMARREPGELPNVFTSGYGDLAINDYLCAVLARAPLELSPTKFHNSVHNAPAGYWTIASGCMASSTALSAGLVSFAAGLLEAATLTVCESTPVLFAAYDVAATGPLQDAIVSDVPFGVAFVLAPADGARTPRLRLSMRDRATMKPAPLPVPLQSWSERNPAAASLPLLRALALREAKGIDFALHADKDLPASFLHTEISF